MDTRERLLVLRKLITLLSKEFEVCSNLLLQRFIYFLSKYSKLKYEYIYHSFYAPYSYELDLDLSWGKEFGFWRINPIIELTPAGELTIYQYTPTEDVYISSYASMKAEEYYSEIKSPVSYLLTFFSGITIEQLDLIAIIQFCKENKEDPWEVVHLLRPKATKHEYMLMLKKLNSLVYSN